MQPRILTPFIHHYTKKPPTQDILSRSQYTSHTFKKRIGNTYQKKHYLSNKHIQPTHHNKKSSEMKMLAQATEKKKDNQEHTI